MNSLIERLESMLESGRDGALLRFGLAQALHNNGRAEDAARHLEQAVQLDPGYSAAWKLLGRARADSGDLAGAAEAWNKGVAAAIARGDKQAAREMEVFLKRLQRG